MAVILNKRAFEHAKELVKKGQAVWDERDARSEHQPSAEQENKFIRLHRFDQYAKWYLEIDDEEREHTKARYKFPFGDFEKVHRCGRLIDEMKH